MFLAYRKASDFLGADMARKFLQTGWTRARRHANHRGGRKYDRASGGGQAQDDPNRRRPRLAVTRT
jgi:hypothetical protein